MNRHPVRVYFEDTDFTGRVYHGAFVRFLERGRSEFLRAAGIDHAALAAAEPARFFTLRTIAMTFRAPASIDELLAVETRPAAGSGRATFRFDQRVVREAVTLVEAAVELCLIDAAGRPVRPPAALSRALCAS